MTGARVVASSVTLPVTAGLTITRDTETGVGKGLTHQGLVVVVVTVMEDRNLQTLYGEDLMGEPVGAAGVGARTGEEDARNRFAEW